MINDVHCHFFSPRFFETLAKDDPRGRFAGGAANEMCRVLGWEPPATVESLAARWVAELDGQQVHRAALIASVSGDEESVAAAVAHAPERFVGFFMLNPLAEDAPVRLERALGPLGLRGVCLSPPCSATPSTIHACRRSPNKWQARPARCCSCTAAC